MIARGASVDVSDEALAAWKVANAAENSKVVFRVTASGDFVCQIAAPGMIILVR